MTLLSFVIPCYRSEKTIEKVVNEIRGGVRERQGYDYEIVLVNDCSPDNVYGVITRLADSDYRIKVVNLAKNMGKHNAMMAGYSVISGDYVVNLDDDCQCPTYEVWKLLKPLEDDECDVTTAFYEVKKESLFKRMGSNFNLWVSEIMLEKPDGLRFENFSIVKRFVADEIIKYKNPYPYYEGLVLRVTKRITQVPMEQRVRGDDIGSGFGLKKSISTFLNGFTSFSVKPLRIASIAGATFALIGFIYGIVIIIRKLFIPEILIGYSSMMAILLLSTGLIMIMLGLVGEYLGRIFICINNSPQYVIKETINVEEKNCDK